jgi:predicted ATPase
MMMTLMTGAPGAGKTTVLTRLVDRVLVAAEPARLVLAKHRDSADFDGQPLSPEAFVERMLDCATEAYQRVEAASTPAFFDRGLPDCIAYARWFDVDPSAAIELSNRYRYHNEALILAPWADIYTTDDERIMTYEMTVGFHEVIEATYIESGYQLIEVPRLPVDERATWVLDRLASG